MLDVIDFITERGGNPERIRESQRRRFESVEVVDEVIALWEDHRKVTKRAHAYVLANGLDLARMLTVANQLDPLRCDADQG